MQSLVLIEIVRILGRIFNTEYKEPVLFVNKTRTEEKIEDK